MGSILYTAQKTAFGGSENAGKKLGAGPTLTPGPHGESIDIVRDFPWTLTPNKSPALNEIPYIHLTEFRYIVSQFEAQARTLVSAIDYARRIAEEEPYKGLYDQNLASGFRYTIPYFNDSFDLNSSWSSIDAGMPNNPGAGIAGAINAGISVAELALGPETAGMSVLAGEGAKLAIKTLGGAAEAGVAATIGMNNQKVGIIDSPKLWKNSAERSYTVEFPLYNTLDENHIQKNWELCYLLTYQNMFNKKTYFTALPPVYYEVYIPGVHYSKASYVSNLKILNKGNIRNLSFGWSGKYKDYNIPDCYVIQLTLQDLLMPSQNQMYLVESGEIVTSSNKYTNAINKAVSEFSTGTKVLNTIKEIGQNSLKGFTGSEFVQ